jgi:hypothetical protein
MIRVQYLWRTMPCDAFIKQFGAVACRQVIAQPSA